MNHCSSINNSESCLKNACDQLEKFNETNVDEEIDHTFIQFIIEQLHLCQKNIHSRKYSHDMMALSVLWHMTSPVLYRTLSSFFILPTVRRIRQLCSGINVSPGDIDISYLNTILHSFGPQDKIVNLMIDEIYTAQRIEFFNGVMNGVTNEGEVAKTVLSFMIKSLNGKFSEVVCLIPINHLKVDTLYNYFMEIMHQLKDFVLVQSVSVDNYSINR